MNSKPPSEPHEIPSVVKLVCPNCMRSVMMSDDAAGTEAPCPECGHSFAIPSRYTPMVSATSETQPIKPPVVPDPPEPAAMSMPSTPSADRPPPPPGLVPSPPHAEDHPLERPLPPPPPVPAAPPGYTRSIGLPLSAPVLAWIPAIFLTLIFLLTFATWVGSYVGETPLYTQNAWTAISGYPSRPNYQIELLLEKQNWPTTEVLNKVHSDWELMLPYVLLLILAMVIAWLERTLSSVRKSVFPRPLQWIPALWPYRMPIVAGLATIAFALLLTQAINGFGLERAMRVVVSERFAEQRKQAAQDPDKLELIEYMEDQELARFNLERTTWFYLGMVLQVLVILSMIAVAALERRGTKPPPRIVIQY